MGDKPLEGSQSRFEKYNKLKLRIADSEIY